MNITETVPTRINKSDYCLIHTALLIFMCLLLLIIPINYYYCIAILFPIIVEYVEDEYKDGDDE